MKNAEIRRRNLCMKGRFGEYTGTGVKNLGPAFEVGENEDEEAGLIL